MKGEYVRDWTGGQPRKWTVVQALATSGLVKDEVLTIDPTTNKLSGSKKGELGTCTHDANTDEVVVAPKGGGTPYRIKRKVCMIGPNASGTGASWVAEEGG
jgi:hypothetical protein